MYKLTNKAYLYYKNNVNNRENVSFEEAQILLNRNIILGDYFKNKGYERIYYRALLIIIKNNEITAIKNRTTHKGKINPLAKKLLNKLMGIGE
jgi:hypothetical protein